MDDKNIRSTLKDNLMKLNQYQLKLFYGMLVHYWAEYRFFISKHNLFNLWCEANYFCHTVDESFPPYDDHDLIKSFCHAHPYYFIDILSPDIVADLFCEHLDDRIDILAMAANKLGAEGLWAACSYATQALGLQEDADELVAQAEEHVQTYS